jgi:hypothetical protein
MEQADNTGRIAQSLLPILSPLHPHSLVNPSSHAPLVSSPLLPTELEQRSKPQMTTATWKTKMRTCQALQSTRRSTRTVSVSMSVGTHAKTLEQARPPMPRLAQVARPIEVAEATSEQETMRMMMAEMTKREIKRARSQLGRKRLKACHHHRLSPFPTATTMMKVKERRTRICSRIASARNRAMAR